MQTVNYAYHCTALFCIPSAVIQDAAYGVEGLFPSPLAYEKPVRPCTYKQSMRRADVQKLAQYPVTATLRKASIIPRPTFSLCTP